MAKRQRPRLGRGLSSLVSAEGEGVSGEGNGVVAEVKPAGGAVDAGGDGAGGPGGGFGVEVGIDEIVASPFQPRTDIDEGSLEQLAQSIARRGVMQPIVVRERAGGGGGYELVAGERRWRAARLAGLARVPAVVRDWSDEEAAEAALVENVQRRDLNAVDRAVGLRSLGERFGWSHGEIADRVGLERPTVTNLIRITELEPGVLVYLARGELSVGHGKALLGAPAGPERESLASSAVSGGWSVRELERRVSSGASGSGARTGSGSNGAASASKPAGVADLERRLGEHLGTRVTIKTAGAKRSKGSVEIAFYDLDHFDGLMRRLGLRDGV